MPADGAAILASNHLSFSDSIFMPLVVPRRVTFLAKQEYFTGRGLKGLLSRLFFTGVGQVPIDRSSGSAAKAALETGKRILGRGQAARASTRRAPARRTAGSTAARPAWPGWRWRPACR